MGKDCSRHGNTTVAQAPCQPSISQTLAVKKHSIIGVVTDRPIAMLQEPRLEERDALYKLEVPYHIDEQCSSSPFTAYMVCIV